MNGDLVLVCFYVGWYCVEEFRQLFFVESVVEKVVEDVGLVEGNDVLRSVAGWRAESFVEHGEESDGHGC